MPAVNCIDVIIVVAVVFQRLDVNIVAVVIFVFDYTIPLVVMYMYPNTNILLN